jgi:hypothetical protein
MGPSDWLLGCQRIALLADRLGGQLINKGTLLGV